MRGCLDEGVLQGYFDGELSSTQMETVRSHLASCQSCTAAARQLESEINLLTSALAPEFDVVVPTARLRQRIDEAVAGLPQTSRPIQSTGSGFGWIKTLGSLFTFTPQRAVAYAGLVVVVAFGVFFGVIQRQQTVTPDTVAKVKPVESPAPPSATINPSSGDPGVNNVASTSAPKIKNEPSRSKARSLKPRNAADNQAVAQVKLLPGERSYLQTIAALDSTIKASSDRRPMRPALQAEYEKNLAVVNRALAATRNAAKNNPNDPDAKEFLFDAYQSKVDLLNTVADARSINRP
ncbi:MAG TPA: zf-HC2 domain-containing protein [Pyrinomonadaceae bacterium]|nr:zf-HC2 domain-containing protein [Pyrinomonadaceae bacterium]